MTNHINSLNPHFLLCNIFPTMRVTGGPHGPLKDTAVYND